MKGLFTLCTAVGLVVATAFAVTQAQGNELQPGDPAPPFLLPGSDGRTHGLADLRGQVVVLAWFPKAFTAG